MAGHSKWANIKHRKGAQDAKRGKVFTKLIKEITVSSRIGGGDPDGNPRLRAALDKARQANMPRDNIDRSIKRGTGEIAGVTYEVSNYEGYGPGGVAIMVEALTDNKNRTAHEIRKIFQKFYRTGRAVASGEVGTGIGLSIVQQIVSHHGGRIDVTSTPGQGSCFTLVLPGCAPERVGKEA